jgi:hypothetical protein
VEAKLERSAGTGRNGLWTGSLLVRRWQGTGTHVLHALLYDRVGNERAYRPEKLDQLGFPSGVRIRSVSDVTPPHGRVRSVTPASVTMTGGADGRLIVVARVRDSGSGVAGVGVTLQGPDTPNGSGLYLPEVRLVRISGTPRDGRWRAALTLDRCTVFNGRWSVSVNAVNRAGQGAALGDAEPVQVAGDDVTRPEASVRDSYTVPPAGPVLVEFTEDVIGIDSSSAVVHAGTFNRASYHYAPTIEPGAWSCADQDGATVDCVVGPVRTATFHPASPLVAGVDQTVVLNPEHVLSVTDLAGNPYLPGGPGFHTRG